MKGKWAVVIATVIATGLLFGPFLIPHALDLLLEDSHPRAVDLSFDKFKAANTDAVYPAFDSKLIDRLSSIVSEALPSFVRWIDWPLQKA